MGIMFSRTVSLVLGSAAFPLRPHVPHIRYSSQWGSPVVANGLVYAWGGNTLHAFDTAGAAPNGTVRWQAEINGQCNGQFLAHARLFRALMIYIDHPHTPTPQPKHYHLTVTIAATAAAAPSRLP